MASRDPWDEFEDEDPWSAFADAPPATKSPSAARQSPSLDLDSITRAVDGDTLAMRSGRNLRLWGVDAPELNQQGWNRQGNPVPIGQQAQSALGALMAGGAGRPGNPVMESWGRPVAPVTLGDMDVGQTLARQGNALAAPEYLGSDHTRRNNYMEAERLARLNRLGMHDVLAQTPQDHRKNPGYVPDRQTVAQWWDTPTPFEGLRPEIEAGYLEATKRGTAADILKYAQANGFTLDPGEVEKFVAARDRGAKVDWEVSYKEPPRLLIDPGDGRTGAAVRGVGSGVLASGLDELGAMADTLGLTPDRENVWNSDRRLADIWSNNQRQNSAILGHDDMAHPITSLVGQIGGGLLVPFGAKARTVPQLFRVGAAYSGAEGFLGTDGDIGQRAIGGAIGVPVGGLIGAGAGKALEWAVRFAPRLMDRLRRNAPDAAPDGPADAVPPPPEGYTLDPDVSAHLDTQAGFSPAPRTANNPPVDVPSGRLVTNEAGGRMNEWQVDEDGRAFVDYRTPSGEVVGMSLLRTGDGIAEINIDPFSSRSNRLGVSGLREAIPLFRQLYPDVHTLTGERWSGAGAGRVQQVRLPDPPPGFTLDPPSMAMNADPMPSVSARQPDYLFPPRASRMDQPLTDTQRWAMAEGIDPRDVLPIPSNIVGDAEEAAAIDAGRFVEARAPHERTELTRRTVRSWNGAEVPKLGSIDMVGWLRLNGGLVDQGGELRHMGLNNAARKVDFAGQEARFGPLVNDMGMTLDDAAMRAWEAGYFPDHTDRPSVNDFLDALRDTHEGRNRRFLPEDQPEIERFYGAQSSRYDLEQQRFETGGPVYADRSEPAGQQPFAPPEAYEEWPAGGPDFAGNINLSKLESPQDIARALDMTQRRVGFDAATRGRVSHAETERLAAELNLTPDALIARRQGQAFNAEEALAARQILAKSGNELVNAAKRIRQFEDPGDELLADFRQKWMRHVAIQEQVSGMTAEAGRALQQFRMAADSRAVRGAVLSALVRGGGGKDDLKSAADQLIDAVEAGPNVFNAVSKKAMQPKWRGRVGELYINFLLSNPGTHVVNMVSNTLTAMAQVPEHGVAAGIGKARSLLPNANIDRVTGSEVGARAFGLIQGAREGARMFATALRTGEPSDFVSKVEGQEYKAIPGALGEVIRVPTRLLTAEDELFKGIARRMELNGLAVRQAHKEGLSGDAAKKRIADLIADPPDDMLERAGEYGRYLTFQQRLGPIAQKVSGITGDSLIAKVYLPFVRTPTNLLKFAAERSPAAPFMPTWRADVMAGGARRDLAVAKALVGTGIGLAIYEAALQGRITGSAPSDPAKARALYADGWQPHSVKIGDTYYSYRRLDPFAMTMGVAADLATLEGGMSERQREEGITLLVASIMGNLASKTWLSGVSDLVGALHEPDRNADRMIQRLIGSFAVPAGIAGVARSIDPTMRQTDTIGEAIQARIPFASQGLLPRRDIWGQPIVNEGGMGPDVISPVRTSTMRNDPVNQALLEYGYTPGMVPRRVGGRDLTPQEHDRYQQLAGQRSYLAIQSLLASEEWKGLGPDDRQDALQDAVRDARKAARGELIKGSRPVNRDAWDQFEDAPGSRGAGSEWDDFDDVPGQANDPWREFDDVPQRNVYSDLQQTIPGVRFTSGFRTPEYQADMRRRGYRPATNSAHLDGSALDMLPPPGRSMEWLKGQVRRYDPDARLLIHDGHLHATFPGYYGAPVLGDARATGLRNPMANMPPPPPGFRIDP